MKARPTITFGKLVRYGLQGATLGVIITAIILVLTVAPDTVQRLRDFKWGYAPLLCGMVVAAWLGLSARIFVNARALGYRISYGQALLVGLSSEFAFIASPAGVGGAAARLTLLRRTGIPLGVATTMLGADMLMDCTFFALLSPVALFVLLTDPEWRPLLVSLRQIPLGGPIVLPLVAVAAVAALALALRGRRLARGAHRIATRSGWGRRVRLRPRLRLLRASLLRNVRHAIDSARFLYRKRRWALVGNLALASVQWSCRYGVLPVLLVAFSTSRNPFPLVLLQGLLFVVSVVLVVPGGGGGVEILTLLILPYFVPRSLAGVVVLLWRLFTYHLYLVVGGGVFFWTLRHMDRLGPPETGENDTAGTG